MERQASYSNRFSRVNKKPVKDCSLALDDLEEGTEYQFRVCAENAAGVGEPCEPISLVAKPPFGQLNHDRVPWWTILAYRGAIVNS